MSTISFVGIALELESVTQVALATIRVTFTQDPLAVSSVGVHDALNPTNWSLAGPGVAIITSCNTVPGDTKSIDLFLTGPLAVGTWIVTASANIQTASGASISAPTSLTFSVASAGKIEPVNVGSVNDTDEDIIRKHLNRALAGGGWNALIAALATGEQTNRTNAQLAFDQLFTSTSSGLYLERKASDSGIDRPDNMGIGDDTFRQYVIRLTNNKLTEESILEILQVFYGDGSLRASCSAALNEPYALQDGDDLQIVLDGILTVNCIFHTADFASIGQAKAIEVASAITRAFRLAGSKAYATNTIDPVTGVSNVVVYSDALGLSSSVRIISGKAQNVLQFPTKLGIYTGVNSPTWNINVNAAAGTTRFTTTSNTVDLSQLQVGDYVNIYGTEFLSGNRGSFAVTSVSVTYPSNALSQYFEISNTKGATQTGLAQLSQSSLLYFRPTLSTIHTTSERNVLVSSQSSLVDVVLPATSQAVSRQALSGAYGQTNSSIAITSMLRLAGVVTVTSPSHGRSVGDWIYVDGAAASITPPTSSPGDQFHSAYGATTQTSATWTTSGISHLWGRAVQLADGRALLISGTQAGSTTPSTQVSLLTITASTPLANGTQYTLTNVFDTAITSGSNFGGACLLIHPAAGNKVLYFGGTTDGISTMGTSVNTAYLYTPGAIGSGGTWAATGSMTFSRMAMAVVQRTDGKVMAIGGTNSGGIPGATVDVYDPVAKTWALAGGMNIGRVFGEAIQLNSTDVLITCGKTGTGAISNIDYAVLSDITNLTNTCETYNISGNAWSYVGSMTYARYGHRLFKLDDGRVIAIGGIGYNPSQSTTAAYLNSTEIYDPNLKYWSAGPSMSVARAFFATQRIGNRIYVIGGSETARNIEYLDTTTLKWSNSTATMPESPDVKISSSCMFGSSNQLMLWIGGALGSNFASFQDPGLLNPNYESFMKGDINGLRQVASVTNSNTFTFLTDTQDYTATGAATFTAVGAQSSTILGPHMFDPAAGVAVTGNETTITQTLAAGQQYATVTVTDATQFPDAPGYVCFAFGYKNQVTPVPYLGRLSSTLLKLDFNFVFPQTISSGSKITLLQQKSPWVSAAPQTAGSFYLTDSSAGRIAASSAIDQAAAAGITVTKSVTYPGDRGLGNEGYPVVNNYKVSDRVEVWASDDVDGDLTKARNGG